MNLFKNKLLKSTAIYTISDGIAKGLNFLTLPLISFYLVPEQLGIAVNYEVLASIISLLSSGVYTNGITYFFYDRDKEKVALIVSNLFMFVIACLITLSLLLLIFHNAISSILYLDYEMQILAIGGCFFGFTNGVSQILYRLEEKPYCFCGFSLLQTILALVSLYIFVVVLRMEALGKIYSGIVVAGLLFVIHFVMLVRRKYFIIKYDYSSLKELLHFGLPLLPHSLSFWLKGGVDKIVLTTFCGLGANGLYSMALSFGGFFRIFIDAFNNSFAPYLQKRLNSITKDNEVLEKAYIVRLIWILIIGFSILAILVIGVCKMAMLFMLDEKYHAAFIFIPSILVMLIFQFINAIVIQFPYFAKRTMGLGLVTFLGGMVQLCSTYFLTKYFGINGINISIVIGSFAIMIGVWGYSNKVYPMPWLSFRKRKDS